jgi:hypothetical protein
MTKIHADIINKVHIENAGSWVFEEGKFKEWLNSNVSSLLWLSGAGKGFEASNCSKLTACSWNWKDSNHVGCSRERMSRY